MPLPTVVDSSPDARFLRYEVEYPGFTTERLYAAWTEPEELRGWWPVEARVDLREGGEYEFRWPKIGVVLLGNYLEVRPGERLAFTWLWAHELGAPEQVVRLSFGAVEGGARLVLEHGLFAEGEEGAGHRRSIAEGWEHFLPRIAGLARER